MTKLSVYPLVADGLSKWCLFYRGNRLYCRSRGKRIFLYLARHKKKHLKLCEIEINAIKEEVNIPQMKKIIELIEIKKAGEKKK